MEPEESQSAQLFGTDGRKSCFVSQITKDTRTSRKSKLDVTRGIEIEKLGERK